jgi:hypothetical protein
MQRREGIFRSSDFFRMSGRLSGIARFVSSRILGFICVAAFGGSEFRVVDASDGFGYDLNGLALHVLVVRVLAGPELALDQDGIAFLERCREFRQIVPGRYPEPADL